MSYGMRLALLALLLSGLACSQTIKYSYDKAGRLVRVEAAGQSIAYTYDAAGNLLRRDRGAGGAVFASISNASFQVGAALAPEMIAAGFDDDRRLAPEVAVTPDPFNWPTELAGTRVEVTDSAGVTRVARLHFVSAGQINYLTPAGMALGAATVRVVTPNGAVTGSMQVDRIAPGIFAASQQGTGVADAFFLRVAAGGAQTQDLLYDPQTRASVPIDLGADGDALYLLLFGTGIRGHQGNVTATAGGESVNVLGAVAQGQFPGLDQVNIGPLPRSLAGRGEVDIVLTVDGKRANTVKVNIR